MVKEKSLERIISDVKHYKICEHRIITSGLPWCMADEDCDYKNVNVVMNTNGRYCACDFLEKYFIARAKLYKKAVEK